MSDLASLGLRIHSEDADLAFNRLDKMTGGAERAERATDSLGGASNRTGSAIGIMLASIERSVAEMADLMRLQQQMTGAAMGQASVIEDLAKVYSSATETETAFVRAMETEAEQHARLDAMVKRSIASYGEQRHAIEAVTEAQSRMAGGGSGTWGGASLSDLLGDMGKVKKAAEDMSALDAEAEKLRRTLSPLYAAQARYDEELDRAHHLLSRGAISQETFSEAVRKAERDLQRVTEAQKDSAGAFTTSRMSVNSLGNSLRRMSIDAASGRLSMAGITGEAGNATNALLSMGGRLGAVGAFMAGPWGAALTVGIMVASSFVSKIMAQNDAMDMSVRKLREQAEATRQADQAKADYAKTIDGVRDAIRDMNREQDRSLVSTRQSELQTYAASKANLDRVKSERDVIKALIEKREAEARGVEARYLGRDRLSPGDVSALAGARQALSEAQADLAKNAADITAAESARRGAAVPVAIREAEELSTAVGRVNRTYDIMKDAAVAAARGSDTLTASLTGTLTTIEKQRQAALEAERQSKRDEAAGNRRDAATLRREEGLGRELEAMRLTAQANLDLARAYGVSDSAALKAAAAAEAVGRATKRQGDVQAFVAAQLELNASKEVARAAQTIADLRVGAEARERMNGLIAAGVITAEQANEQLALEAELRPLIAASKAVEGKASDILNKQIDALTEARKRDIAAVREAGLLQIETSNRDRLEVLRLEHDLIGANNIERSRQLAMLEEEIRLRNQYGKTFVNSSRGQSMIAQAGEGAAYGAQTQRDLARYNLGLTEQLDLLRQIDDHMRGAASGMTEAFGEAGRAVGDVAASLTGYHARLEEIRVVRDQMARDGVLNSARDAMFARDAAQAQIAAYGDAAAAAKGFFREGSDGYKLLHAAEQGYRLFQFAMSVQAMAMGSTETAASVAQSATRGAASMAAGAAKMFEFLGPLGFPAVAAMLGLLAGLGLKGGSKGGGRGGYSPSNDNVDASVEAARSQAIQQERAQDSAAQSLASRVEVRVTADRDGLNAYVVKTAQREAANVAAPMAGAAAATAKQDTLKALAAQQRGNRKAVI